jgi:hypothetical protein
MRTAVHQQRRGSGSSTNSDSAPARRGSLKTMLTQLSGKRPTSVKDFSSLEQINKAGDDDVDTSGMTPAQLRLHRRKSYFRVGQSVVLPDACTLMHGLACRGACLPSASV